MLSQAFQTQRPKFQAAALKVSTELLQREGGRGGKEGNEENNIVLIVSI